MGLYIYIVWIMCVRVCMHNGKLWYTNQHYHHHHQQQQQPIYWFPGAPQVTKSLKCCIRLRLKNCALMLLQLCPGSLYTQTIQFWWSSAVAVSAKKFVRSRSHSGWFPDVFSSRVESRAALSGKELGRLGLAIHWGICGHGNRITPEHHTSHHCRTYPFCITSKHTSSGNIAYMMYMYIYIR